jgi:hypothetical protein
MSTQIYTADDLRDFLKSLDESEVQVTDWEAQFLEGNLDEIAFSPKQRKSILLMIEKYGQRIGWL